MVDRAKNRTLVTVQLLDGCRRQLSWHLCRLTVPLSEPNIMNDDGTLTGELIAAFTKLEHALFIARARVLRSFLAAYPDAPILEAGEDNYQVVTKQPTTRTQK